MHIGKTLTRDTLKCKFRQGSSQLNEIDLEGSAPSYGFAAPTDGYESESNCQLGAWSLEPWSLEPKSLTGAHTYDQSKNSNKKTDSNVQQRATAGTKISQKFTMHQGRCRAVACIGMPEM